MKKVVFGEDQKPSGDCNEVRFQVACGVEDYGERCRRMVLDLTAELGSGGETEASGVEEGFQGGGPTQHKRSPPPVPPRSSNSKPRLPTPNS